MGYFHFSGVNRDLSPFWAVTSDLPTNRPEPSEELERCVSLAVRLLRRGPGYKDSKLMPLSKLRGEKISFIPFGRLVLLGEFVAYEKIQHRRFRA